jgi:2-hydroxymuconate-semialdehyde hydrolase
MPYFWSAVQPEKEVAMNSQVISLENGMKIHYLIAGDRDVQPVVLLHGYPSNCYLWRHAIPELAKHFCVIAPDLPGHGKSDKPLDVNYDMDFFVGFLKEFYDALEIKQAHLVAHDLGGMAALGFVSRHPGRTQRFVIMDTAPYVEWPRALRYLIKKLQNPVFARLSLFRFTFALNFKQIVFYRKDAVTDEIVDLYWKPWVENRNSAKAFRKVIMVSPEEITEPVENLRKIQHRTLILWAEKDRLFSVKIARQLNADLPNSELRTIPDCGHFLPEEQPELVTRHMVEFLSS